MDSSSKPSIFMLLQPDLLTIEELREILATCCVSKKTLNSNNKGELVEIFKRVALPLPQRICNDTTWRGRLLAKKQGQRKRKIVMSASVTDLREAKVSKQERNLDITESSPEIQKQTSSEPVPNRLKPPIDLINFQRKVIKLNKSSSHSINELDKIVIKSKSEKSEVNLEKSKNSQVKDVKSVEKSKTEITKPEKCVNSCDTSLVTNKLNGSRHKKIKIDFSDPSERTTATPKVINSKQHLICIKQRETTVKKNLS